MVSILRLLVRSGLYTHTIPDPIILSNDESTDTESENDYSDLRVGLITKSDSSSPYIADNGEGFVSGTTYTSDLIITNY